MNAETAAQKFADKLKVSINVRHASAIGNRVFSNTLSQGSIFMFYDTEPDIEEIRTTFKELSKIEYACFIVAKDLLPGEGEILDDTPDWMRVLHGMYLGQIYAYDEQGTITSCHLEPGKENYMEKTCSWNPTPIDPTLFRVRENDCWVNGWKDVMYRTASFRSESWWKKDKSQHHESSKHYSERKERRQKQQQSNSTGNGWEDFKRWQREYQSNYRSSTSLSQWAQSLKLLGVKEPFTQEQLKAAYRAKAKQLHPDLNKERDTTEDMKAVNLAYEYLKT